MAKAPEDCATMAEVRAGVDALDRKLVALLAERLRYMAAAARIKPTRNLVRDDARKAQVIANARALAAEHGMPVDIADAIYEALVETCIAYELGLFDAARENV